MQLSKSIALVTGGASGLGEATVRHFCASGSKVAILDRDLKRGEALAKELGNAVHFVDADVTSEVSVKAAISEVVQQFGGLSVAVNCAGVASATKTFGRDGPHPLNSFTGVVDINLSGTFNVLRLAAEAMAENDPNADGERGVIINTASAAAFDGQKGQAAYAASKGAVHALSLPVARDLAFNGIRICAIAPGLFLTPMFEGLGSDVCAALAKDVTFPKRLGRPEEFARLAATIVDVPYLNGTTIRLDGAIRLP